RGQFASELRKDGWDGEIVSFEPLPSAYAALATRASSDTQWTAVNVAIGAARGVATLKVAGNEVSSSLLEMSERHRAAAPESEFVEEVDVNIETVDSVVAKWHLGGRFYLKIDTQGYELDVLLGADSTIDACPAIELELSLEELYE